MINNLEKFMLDVEGNDFYDLLSYYLDDKFKLNNKSSIKNILNICCGTINEEFAIYKYFSDKINLFSIDKIDYSNEVKRLKRKSFICDNIVNYNKYLNSIDFLIGRNIPISSIKAIKDEDLAWMNINFPNIIQDLNNNYLFWKNTFENLFNDLNKNSYFLFTFLRKDEMNTLTDIISNYNYFNNKKEIIIKYKNKNVFPIKNNEIGSSIINSRFKDNYCLIGFSN